MAFRVPLRGAQCAMCASHGHGHKTLREMGLSHSPRWIAQFTIEFIVVKHVRYTTYISIDDDAFTPPQSLWCCSSSTLRIDVVSIVVTVAEKPTRLELAKQTHCAPS